MSRRFAIIAAFVAGVIAAICWDTRSTALAEYMPHVSGDHVAGMLVKQDSREWASLWVSYGKGALEWRDPKKPVGNFEYMSFRDDGWLYLDRLDQWAITCIKAEIEWNGVVTQIPCSNGHPYAPKQVPHDPYTMRVWIDVGGQRAYWQATFTPGLTVTNSCWFGGAITATDVLEQKDSWWSRNSGWDRATGTLPYSPTGNPIRPTVDYLYTVTLAKGYGVWTIDDRINNVQYCAYSGWTWK